MGIRFTAFLLCVLSVMAVTLCACRAPGAQEPLFFEGIDTFSCRMQGECNGALVAFSLQKTANGSFLLTYPAEERASVEENGPNAPTEKKRGAAVSYRLQYREGQWQTTAMCEGIEMALSAPPPLPMAVVQIFTLTQADLRECKAGRSVFACDAGEVTLCADPASGSPTQAEGKLHGVTFSFTITDFAKGAA